MMILAKLLNDKVESCKLTYSIEESKIAIKKRDEKEIQIISIEEFIKIIKEEIKQRKN